MKAPLPIPAAPTPAMARPIIRATEVGATPQIKLPTSNINIQARKVIFRGKYLYTFPHVDWKPPIVINVAEPYQDTSLRVWNSSVILGIAVATIV